MPRFLFESIGPSGTLMRGSLEARDDRGAIDELIAGGQTPVSLRPISERTGVPARLSMALRRRSFDHRLFLHELGTLLKAGLRIDRALTMLESISPNARHAMRVGQLRDRIRAGVSMSSAFSALVPEAPVYVSRLIAAGEAGGRLGDVVARIAGSLDRAKAMRDRLVSGLLYPAILFAAMLAVLWIVFSTVLPRLVPMFEDAGAALPESTALLLAIDRFFSDYGWLLLTACGAAFIGLAYALSRPGGRRAVDRFLLTSRIAFRLPAQYEAARFCRTLQTLLEGGLSIEKALALARDSAANSWFAHELDTVRRSVIEGRPLHMALEAQTALPRLVVEFAAVGEESGRLDAMIGEVADILDKAVETRLDRLAALVVPVTTLILGALVSGIMAGVVSGILAVNDLAR